MVESCPSFYELNLNFQGDTDIMSAYINSTGYVDVENRFAEDHDAPEIGIQAPWRFSHDSRFRF